jgi:hypothetical protein
LGIFERKQKFHAAKKSVENRHYPAKVTIGGEQRPRIWPELGTTFK